ncbi:MAG TPA: class I SAM-dependent methyltransferase [Tepidisphaeraceae bacterium]
MPRALFDTFHGAVQARCIMIAVKLGIIESLADGPKTLEQISHATHTDLRALEKLLSVLTACRYLTLQNGKWMLRVHTRRWLARSSPRSIADNILHRFVEWDAIELLEQFVLTGQPMDLHDRLPTKDWGIYQRGMKCLAALAVGEVVARLRLPRSPRRMLDIGGSHGLYSVQFCRRYPTLEAVILDLPEAVEHAAPLLADEKMGRRVMHRTGDALTDSLGEREWDFIFISQLMHHFTVEMNVALCQRIARALKPGGVFAIAEIERTSGPAIGSVFDLYFAATSRSGTWSAQELQSWQTRAGMKIKKPLWLWTVPGIVIVPAEVPGQ